MFCGYNTDWVQVLYNFVTEFSLKLWCVLRDVGDAWEIVKYRVTKTATIKVTIVTKITFKACSMIFQLICKHNNFLKHLSHLSWELCLLWFYPAYKSFKFIPPAFNQIIFIYRKTNICDSSYCILFGTRWNIVIIGKLKNNFHNKYFQVIFIQVY